MFTKTIEVHKYIPIAGEDARPFAAKWQDREFLSRVKAFANNGTYQDLVLKALGQLRDIADVANNPDQLKGVQEGIKAVKWLLTAPAEAAQMIGFIDEQGRRIEESKGDSLG